MAYLHRVYADFLAEADRYILLSIEPDSKIMKAIDLREVMQKYSEIELVASDNVVTEAKSICDYVVGSQSSEPIPKANYYELQQAFIRAAKAELATLQEVG